MTKMLSKFVYKTTSNLSISSQKAFVFYLSLAVNIGIATKQLVNATKAILDNRFKRHIVNKIYFPIIS